MKVEIKSVTVRDVPRVYEMILELAKLEHLEHELELTEEMLLRALTGYPSLAEGLIAFQEDEPVAYAIYFHNFSTFQSRRGLYLEDIYVRPDYRSKGIGKALLRYLARIAVERDCGRFEWAVLAWNKPAIRFYEALGAEIQNDYRICRMSGKALSKLVLSERNPE